MDWVQTVRDVGFPIVVALLLLIKLDASLNQLRQSMDELKKVLWEVIHVSRKE